MTIVPITLREANDFVEQFHRHNGRAPRVRDGEGGWEMTGQGIFLWGLVCGLFIAIAITWGIQ